MLVHQRLMPVQFTHTYAPLVVYPSVCTLSFVCSFHAAERSVHTPFGSNEIHGPDGKLTQQGEQTSVYVCKSFVA